MRILVYVDPSSRGEWAIAPAVDLARGLCRTITLLTTEENLKQDPTLLERAAKPFQEIENVEVETRSRPGPARQAILTESSDSVPTITVFPPAGRWTLSRMLRGSRVKTVVHNSPSTVMVARRPVSDHIRRILVTVSGGPMSETTLASAQEIAHAVGAEWNVLHVSSTVAIPFGEVKTEAPPAHEPVKKMLAKLAGEGDPVRVLVRNGMVVHEILQECHDGGYDLLILGQHLADRETGGPLSENIAEILAVECPIPVLIVRPTRWAANTASGA